MLPTLRLVRTQVDPLADPVARRAAELLRSELTRPWTVTTLARRLAVSRPVLARRFRAAHGVSPMRYLTRLRMERAAELLTRAPELGLAEVATCVGYGSEFAFNRAFKRHHGRAPGGYRRFAPSLRAAA
jgi:transcriptional regulator GlxA family with amidase domain